ncbi:MAG: acetyl-CoA carboxylase carboxyl transferase subunit alpha, partial [Deltaproteobacteria bacterium]|nr:acetyl-CoA carboxylase carboxyl transferase subunit alpha [Deltaproteobacteria bacterium]
VISPEGCAAILWGDGTLGPQAAEALRLTAQDIDNLGDVIDGVIPEPTGGAHNDPKAAAEYVKKALLRHLDELKRLSGAELVEQRYRKFRAMTRMQK